MKFFALAAAVFISYCSFAQVPLRQDTIIYYVTISKQINEIRPKVQNFWGQVQMAVIDAGESSSHKADRTVIDNLKSSSSYNINDLDRALRTLNALSETDPPLAVKQNLIDLFTDLKTAQQAAMPVILSVLSAGMDKVTPQQTSSVKAFISKGREMQGRLRQIEQLLFTYQQKYSITADDKRKFGL